MPEGTTEAERIDELRELIARDLAEEGAYREFMARAGPTWTPHPARQIRRDTQQVELGELESGRATASVARQIGDEYFQTATAALRGSGPSPAPAAGTARLEFPEQNPLREPGQAAGRRAPQPRTAPGRARATPQAGQGGGPRA